MIAWCNFLYWNGGNPLKYNVTSSRSVFSSHDFPSGHTHPIPSPGSVPGPEGKTLHFYFFNWKRMLHLVFHACIFHQKKRTPSQVLVLYLCNLIKPRNQSLVLSFIESYTGNFEKLPNKFTVFSRHFKSCACLLHPPSCRIFLWHYTSCIVRNKATCKRLSQINPATKGLIK